MDKIIFLLCDEGNMWKKCHADQLAAETCVHLFVCMQQIRCC